MNQNAIYKYTILLPFAMYVNISFYIKYYGNDQMVWRPQMNTEYIYLNRIQYGGGGGPNGQCWIRSYKHKWKIYLP